MKSSKQVPSDASLATSSHSNSLSGTATGVFKAENGPGTLSLADIRDEEDIYDQIQNNNRKRKARKRKLSKNGPESLLLASKVLSMDQKLKKGSLTVPLPKMEDGIKPEDEDRIRVRRLILDNFASLRLEEDLGGEQTSFRFRLYLYAVLHGQEQHFDAPTGLLRVFRAKLEQLSNVSELSYNHDAKFVVPNHHAPVQKPLLDGSRTVVSIEIPSVVRKRLNIKDD